MMLEEGLHNYGKFNRHSQVTQDSPTVLLTLYKTQASHGLFYDIPISMCPNMPTEWRNV